MGKGYSLLPEKAFFCILSVMCLFPVLFKVSIDKKILQKKSFLDYEGKMQMGFELLLPNIYSIFLVVNFN